MSEQAREHYIERNLKKPTMSDFEKPIGTLQKLRDNPFLRRLFVCAVILIVWEIGARWMAWRLDNGALLLPSVADSFEALWNSGAGPQRELWGFVWESLKSLLTGFALGAVLACSLVVFAVNRRIGEDFLSTICAAFATLPAIAILPLSQTWFGITWSAIVAVTTFAAVFPIANSMYQGFRSVSPTMRNVGHNMGLTGLSFTARVLIPAALPSIMTGLRGGMSNAFRALVATEMVMGAASGAGGLGWMVFGAKQNLEMPIVYGGLVAIMLVGLAFEGLFALMEKRTIRRWGMLR